VPQILFFISVIPILIELIGRYNRTSFHWATSSESVEFKGVFSLISQIFEIQGKLSRPLFTNILSGAKCILVARCNDEAISKMDCQLGLTRFGGEL